MVLRVVLFLVVAIVYAALAGACSFVWTYLTFDPGQPGSMILEDNAWGAMLVIFVTVIAVALGGFVALSVGLTRSNKPRGALFGSAVGVLLFLIIVANGLRGWASVRSRFELLQALVLWFVVFPVGLSLTGVAASAVASRLKD